MTQNKNNTLTKFLKKTAALLASVGILFGGFRGYETAVAATTAATTINYQGRLLNNSNDTLSGAYTFRFSMWSDADFTPGTDVNGAGAIDVGAPGYAGWQETHAITVGSFGLFNLDLGSITTLPNMTAGTHDYLQVEVKVTGAADTTFEVLDVAGTTADATDRKPIHAEAYVRNADYIDNREIGTADGDIAILSTGGVFDEARIPDGTDQSSFVIDDDNTEAGDITLQFGNTLAKTLLYSQANDRFEFNDDVNIAGDVTFTGTINGISLTAIPFANMATRVKELALSPEFPYYTVEPDGADNRGKLISDFEDAGGTDKRNYYEWTTKQVAIQDMDVVLSIQLPLDFVSFTGAPLSVNYRTSDGVAATNAVDVELFDTTGTAVGLTGGSSLASGAWSTANITFGGAPTFTAGDTITLKLKLSSISTGYARVSDVVLNYNGR